MPSGSRTTSVHVLLSLSGEACPSTPLQWQPCPWRIWWGSLPLQLHGLIQVHSSLQFMSNSLKSVHISCAERDNSVIKAMELQLPQNNISRSPSPASHQVVFFFWFFSLFVFIFMDYSSVGQPGVFVINSKLWRKQHMQEVVIFSKPSPKGERNLKNTIKYKFEFVFVTKHYRLSIRKVM